MKIFICCSKAFYGQVRGFVDELESSGHEVILPNSYDEPAKEAKMKALSHEEYSKWKQEMLALSVEKIKDIDALLVLNSEKKGVENYIGGATFIEVYEAVKQNKKIFLWNPVPDGILRDEIVAMNPIILNRDLSLVR